MNFKNILYLISDCNLYFSRNIDGGDFHQFFINSNIAKKIIIPITTYIPINHQTLLIDMMV